MDYEMNAMKTNYIWQLVELPPDQKLVKSKWTFKQKDDEGKALYKARFVAQGYSQRPGEDYDEVFAPVVRFESVRTLMTLVVKHKMKMHQMDVTSARRSIFATARRVPFEREETSSL